MSKDEREYERDPWGSQAPGAGDNNVAQRLEGWEKEEEPHLQMLRTGQGVDGRA